MKKAIIIGIDGGTFSLIDKYIKQGALSYLAKVMRNGVSAYMRSVDQDTRVPISPTIWTSLATGKTADKHGIKSFFNLQQDIKTARLFEILKSKGMSKGNWGWELTWPPVDYGSFNIPCAMARDDRTIPSSVSVVQEMRRSTKKGRTGLFRNISYFLRLKKLGVSTATMNSLIGFYLKPPIDKKQRMLERMLIGNRINEDIFISLCRKYQPDVSFFFIPSTDSAAHYFWKYSDNENFPDIDKADREKYGHYMHRVYEEADRKIERIHMMNPDAALFIISDHGMGPIREGSFETLSLRSSAFLREAEIQDKVDFFHVGLNIVVVPKENTGMTVDWLYNYLSNMKIVEAGMPLFEVIEKDSTGRIYIKVQQKDKGFYDKHTLETLHVRMGTKKIPMKDIIDVNDLERSADHHPDGIFMAMGKDIKKHADRGRCSIYDFLPTFLSYMNIPLAEDFDGNDLNITGRPGNSTVASYDNLLEAGERVENSDDSLVKEELRKLGYLKDDRRKDE